ncbi:MAG: M64 family metallopeptidase [Bacteroidales bacterium]|nr:M64 family metallopeptidase [Bacteroidales bacterium]
MLKHTVWILLSVAVLNTGCKPDPTLSVSVESINFSENKEDYIINITSNTTWRVMGGDGWCIGIPATGSGNGTVRVAADSNKTYSHRNTQIIITAETLSSTVAITQAQTDALILTQKIFSLPSTTGSVSAELKSNISYDVIIPADANWVTKVKSKALSTSLHEFAVAANDTYDKRVARIIFKDKNSTLSDTLTINQAQKDALILTQKIFNVPSSASSISVELRSNISYTILLPPAVSWVTKVNTKALTTYLHQFTIAANETYDSRSAKIIFKDNSSSLSDTLTIVQAQRDAIIFSPVKSFVVQKGGATINYTLQSNIQYNVTLSAGVSWISEIKTKGLVNNSHSFAVAANSTNIIREGSVIFASVNNLFKDTLRIRQSGFEGYYVYNPNGKALADIIPAAERASVTRLKVEGEISAADFLFLRDNLSNLEYLNLEEATVESNKIPDNAFKSTSAPGKKIKEVKFPSNLVSIGAEAFLNCTSLTAVEFPASVSSIGSSAFAGCSRLAMVISRVVTPFALNGVFTGIDAAAHLVMPVGSLNAYKTTTGWGYAFFDKIYEEGTDPSLGGEEDPEDPGEDPEDPPDPGYTINDGDYTLLQIATMGSGVKLVFLGDGFNRADIESGKYINTINAAVEHFFAIEPYKTYRNHFTVYVVYGVSAQSGISDLTTTVDTKFQTKYTGTYPVTSMTVNYTTCFTYAQKAPVGSLSNTLITVIANSSRYGGTCRLYSDGAAIAIAPVSELNYPYDFRGLVQHEAGGHGFGKLADEYVTNVGYITDSEKNTLRQWQSFNHFKNVDLTNNLSEIIWKHFVGVTGYSYVGAWEGGYYYGQGVFRPEQRSLMINNIKYINAPGRELIVKRIKQLAGLPYSFDEFRARDVMELNVTTKAGEPAFDAKMALPPPILIIR